MTLTQQNVIDQFYNTSRSEHKTFLVENVDFNIPEQNSRRYGAYMKKALYGNGDSEQKVEKKTYEHFVSQYPNLCMMYMLDVFTQKWNDDVASSEFSKQHVEFTNVLFYLYRFASGKTFSFNPRISKDEAEEFIQNSILLSENEKKLFKTVW